MELDDESSTGSRTDAEEGPEELLAGASASREVSGETVNPIQNLSAIRQALQDGEVVHQGYKLTDELAPLPLDLLHQTLTHDEVSSYDNDSRLSSQSTAMLRIIVKRRRHLLRNLPPATASFKSLLRAGAKKKLLLLPRALPGQWKELLKKPPSHLRQVLLKECKSTTELLELGRLQISSPHLFGFTSQHITDLSRRWQGDPKVLLAPNVTEAFCLPPVEGWTLPGVSETELEYRQMMEHILPSCDSIDVENCSLIHCENIDDIKSSIHQLTSGHRRYTLATNSNQECSGPKRLIFLFMEAAFPDSMVSTDMKTSVKWARKVEMVSGRKEPHVAGRLGRLKPVPKEGSLLFSDLPWEVRCKLGYEPARFGAGILPTNFLVGDGSGTTFCWPAHILSSSPLNFHDDDPLLNLHGSSSLQESVKNFFCSSDNLFITSSAAALRQGMWNAYGVRVVTSAAEKNFVTKTQPNFHPLQSVDTELLQEAQSNIRSDSDSTKEAAESEEKLDNLLKDRRWTHHKDSPTLNYATHIFATLRCRLETPELHKKEDPERSQLLKMREHGERASLLFKHPNGEEIKQSELWRTFWRHHSKPKEEILNFRKVILSRLRVGISVLLQESRASFLHRWAESVRTFFQEQHLQPPLSRPPIHLAKAEDRDRVSHFRRRVYRRFHSLRSSDFCNLPRFAKWQESGEDIPHSLLHVIHFILEDPSYKEIPHSRRLPVLQQSIYQLQEDSILSPSQSTSLVELSPETLKSVIQYCCGRNSFHSNIYLQFAPFLQRALSLFAILCQNSFSESTSSSPTASLPPSIRSYLRMTSFAGLLHKLFPTLKDFLLIAANQEPSDSERTKVAEWSERGAKRMEKWEERKSQMPQDQRKTSHPPSANWFSSTTRDSLEQLREPTKRQSSLPYIKLSKGGSRTHVYIPQHPETTPTPTDNPSTTTPTPTTSTSYVFPTPY